METVLTQTLELGKEHGPWFVLCLLIGFGLSFLLWKLAWAVFELFKDFITNVKNNNQIVVESNNKFAESSEKMVELVENLTGQITLTAQELSFIKKNIQKQNIVIIDIAKLIEHLAPNDPETTIRIENIIKEIQRPIDG